MELDDRDPRIWYRVLQYSSEPFGSARALADKAEHRKKLARADCSFDLGRADTQPRETQQIS
jgi:hypothetical protein